MTMTVFMAISSIKSSFMPKTAPKPMLENGGA